MSRIRHIVFDIDGTLLDTKSAFTGALETALGARGIEHGDITKYFSLPLANAVADFELDAESFMRWETDYADRLSRAPLYPGVKAMLDALKNRVGMALVTSRKRNVAKLGLENAGLTDYFSLVIAADDVTHPKPDAEPLDVYRRTAHCEKDEMLFVGDSIVDLMCAQNAGVKFLAPGWAETAPELEPYRASCIDVVARTAEVSDDC